jgi:hypothetical protein
MNLLFLYCLLKNNPFVSENTKEEVVRYEDVVRDYSFDLNVLKLLKESDIK